MCPSEPKKTSPIVSTSAQPVPVRFQPDESLSRLNLTATNKVCGNCKELSVTLWANIGVIDTGFPTGNPLDLLKLTRRVSLCTACGTIKATT